MAESEASFCTIAQAMERLGLSRAELYRRVKDKALKADKADRRLRFAEDELQRYSQVLAAERETVQEALSRWLTFFAERLVQSGREEPPSVVEKTTAEQVAELGRRILLSALAGEVNNLYLDPLHQGDRLLVGVDGHRTELARFPAPLAGPLKNWFKALAALTQLADSGVFEGLGKYQDEGAARQFRLAVVPTLLGEHLHLHIYLDRQQKTLEELGYTPAQSTALSGLLVGRPGLLLVVGPAEAAAERHRLALARQLSAAGRLVVSLEHRIQYRAEELIQLDLPTGQPFEPLWRAALGMGPDVLLFDQVDSAAEARSLLEGVGSGAVVVAQLLAPTALDGLGQLLRFEMDRQALSRALLGVVERAVMRRLCPACRTSRPPTPEEAALLDVAPEAEIGVAQRCDHCGDGFSGRRYLCGLWPTDDGLAPWIRRAAPDSPLPAPPPELSLAAAARQAVLEKDALLEEALPFLRG